MVETLNGAESLDEVEPLDGAAPPDEVALVLVPLMVPVLVALLTPLAVLLLAPLMVPLLAPVLVEMLKPLLVTLPDPPLLVPLLVPLVVLLPTGDEPVEVEEGFVAVEELDRIVEVLLMEVATPLVVVEPENGKDELVVRGAEVLTAKEGLDEPPLPREEPVEEEEAVEVVTVGCGEQYR